MVSGRRLKEGKGVHMYETRKNKEKFKICENHEFIYWKMVLLTYTFCSKARGNLLT